MEMSSIMFVIRKRPMVVLAVGQWTPVMLHMKWNYWQSYFIMIGASDCGIGSLHFRIVSCVNWKADFAAMLWLLYIAWARIFPHFIKKDTKSYMLFMVVTGHISIL